MTRNQALCGVLIATTLALFSVCSGESAGSGGQEPWYQRPWIVVCDATMFDGPVGRLCDPDSDDFVAHELHTSLTRATAMLRALGWEQANIWTVPSPRVVAAGWRTVPPISEQAARTAPRLLNFAGFHPFPSNTANTARGAYYGDDGQIFVSQRALEPDLLQRRGDVITHEIFHAVQQAVAAPLLEAPAEQYGWIVEGMATTLGFSALSPGDDQQLTARVFEGIHRDWSYGLADNRDPARPYRTFEFFALADGGSVDYFHSLLSQLSARIRGADSYVDIDEAFAAMGYGGLAEVYLRRVLPQRSCKVLNTGVITVTDEDVERGYIDESATGIPLSPLSSACLDIRTSQYEAIDVAVASDHPGDVLLALGEGTVNGDEDFTFAGVRATIAGSGTLVTVTPGLADIRIVRQDLRGMETRPWRVLLSPPTGDDSETAADLTGTWGDYDNHLRLLQVGDNLTGEGYVSNCELPAPIVTATVSGYEVAVRLRPTHPDGWVNCPTSFELRVLGDTLSGRWVFRFPGQPEVTERVVLRKVSDDPNYLIDNLYDPWWGPYRR
jgi:hypothetical protein